MQQLSSLNSSSRSSGASKAVMTDSDRHGKPLRLEMLRMKCNNYQQAATAMWSK